MRSLFLSPVMFCVSFLTHIKILVHSHCSRLEQTHLHHLVDPKSNFVCSGTRDLKQRERERERETERQGEGVREKQKERERERAG